MTHHKIFIIVPNIEMISCSVENYVANVMEDIRPDLENSWSEYLIGGQWYGEMLECNNGLIRKYARKVSLECREKYELLHNCVWMQIFIKQQESRKYNGDIIYVDECEYYINDDCIIGTYEHISKKLSEYLNDYVVCIDYLDETK